MFSMMVKATKKYDTLHHLCYISGCFFSVGNAQLFLTEIQRKNHNAYCLCLLYNQFTIREISKHGHGESTALKGGSPGRVL